MPVSFENIEIGGTYSRPQLSGYWGYRGFQAIGRGVFTPAKENKIVLFITKDKQSHLTQYIDSLDGERLTIQGEKNHAADKRLINAAPVGDEIHLFYRPKHHQDFTYYGEVFLVEYAEFAAEPSRFAFSLNRFDALAHNTLATDNEAFGTADGEQEGAKRTAQTTRYERSRKNRAAALKFHGTKCKACGFDYDEVYGAAHARQYIQVHHCQSVTSGLRRIDPTKDLIPLCANCHAMAHRTKGKILAVEDLQSLLATAKG